MRLRGLYALAGLVLGALAGLAVAFQVFAVAAGVSWLFLFGDDPWPAGVQVYLLAIPLAAGLATLGAGAAAGYVLGRRCETRPRPARARRIGTALLLAGLAGWLLVSVLALGQHERQVAARASAAAGEAAFDRLRQARHVIAGVRELEAGAGEVRLALALAGTRRGDYRLAWRLDDPLYGVTLSSGERPLSMGPEAATVDLAFDTATLAERYRETVLKGRADRVLVDATLRLRLTLAPVLEAGERRSLPAREVGNLERGLSELIYETAVDVPVALDLTGP